MKERQGHALSGKLDSMASNFSYRTSRYIALAIAFSCPLSLTATEVVVATVNNRQMIEMQKLTPEFERANADIKIKWVTLSEAELRQKVSSEVGAKTGTYDIVTIGMYETPIWAAKGWLKEFQPPESYNVKDLIPTVKDGLSYGKRLYAAPFYGEGSMTVYRRDLLEKAGLSMHDRPTWAHITEAAAKMHNPASGVYGICLRGRAGWGDNMALITTMVNSHGGQWFDMAWRPQVATKPWKDAIELYVKLMRNYGPPNAADNSFNENLQLFLDGKCAILVDATSVGGALVDRKLNRLADQVGFALAPYATTTKGAGWLWSWALAIPSNSKNGDAAQRFIQWATSEAYLNLVAQSKGWAAIPSGTRLSTYRRTEFLAVSRFALIEAIAMVTSNPRDATDGKVPYVGVQYVGIPEFQEIGDFAGKEIRAALIGNQSVETALNKTNLMAEQQLRTNGYYK